MSAKYAIVETGGKQYRVQPDQIVDVERLPVAAGETVVLDRVLMVVEGEGKTIVGRPTVPGAQVMAEVLGEKKGEKIIVFKFHPKTRYRRKSGHRQIYTSLQIKEVRLAEAEPVVKRRRRKVQDGT